MTTQKKYIRLLRKRTKLINKFSYWEEQKNVCDEYMVKYTHEIIKVQDELLKIKKVDTWP